jgi:hypothetical protein
MRTTDSNRASERAYFLADSKQCTTRAYARKECAHTQTDNFLLATPNVSIQLSSDIQLSSSIGMVGCAFVRLSRSCSVPRDGRAAAHNSQRSLCSLPQPCSANASHRAENVLPMIALSTIEYRNREDCSVLATGPIGHLCEC